MLGIHNHQAVRVILACHITVTCNNRLSPPVAECLAAELSLHILTMQMQELNMYLQIVQVS